MSLALLLLLPRAQHKGLAPALHSLERLGKLSSPLAEKTALCGSVWPWWKGTEACPAHVPAELWLELAHQLATCSCLKVPEKGSRKTTQVTAGEAEVSLL